MLHHVATFNEETLQTVMQSTLFLSIHLVPINIKWLKMASESFLMVGAIDFGTAYSGYAFSARWEFERDPLKVDFVQKKGNVHRCFMEFKLFSICVFLYSRRAVYYL